MKKWPRWKIDKLRIDVFTHNVLINIIILLLSILTNILLINKNLH